MKLYLSKNLNDLDEKKTFLFLQDFPQIDEVTTSLGRNKLSLIFSIKFTHLKLPKELKIEFRRSQNLNINFFSPLLFKTSLILKC